MSDRTTTDGATPAEAMRRINRAWLDRRPGDLTPLLHPEVVTAAPGFGARTVGRDAMIAGFVEFIANAEVYEFREDPYEVDVPGETAVVSYRYAMTYGLAGSRYRATGRDVWVFARDGGAWRAVWRTMLDTAEEPA